MDVLPDDTDEQAATLPEIRHEENAMEHAYPVHSFNHYNYPRHDRDGVEELILSNQIGGGFRDTLSTIHDSSINVMQSVEHNGLAGIQETARQGSTNLGATERNGGEVRATVERSAGDVGMRVERNGGETRAHLDRFQISLIGEICDVRKEASDNKAEIMLDACKNTHSLTLQAAENFAKMQLQAAENAARASRELAECCCEMKALVLSEHCTTRELISNTEQNRLRDDLAAKNQQLLLLQINGNGPGNSLR